METRNEDGTFTPGHSGNPDGPDTLYRSEYADQARKLCLAFGATDAELADFFEVTDRTIRNWKHEFPDFAAAVRKGKTIADAEVADRLYNRAMGYTHPETKVFCVDGKIVTHEITKHHPPDTMAGMYWLNNRQRKNWKTRQSVEHSVLTEDIARAIELGIFTDDELEQISAGRLTKDLIDRCTAAARTAADPGPGGAAAPPATEAGEA